MSKLIAAAKSVLDPKNSETYSLWGGVALTLAGHYLPGVMGALDSVAGAISEGKMSGGALIGTLFLYAAQRMGSKAAKA